MSAKTVDLGFFNGDYKPWDLEKEFKDFELESRYFPSKVGGNPAWLDLANLPKPTELQCRVCGAPSKFLLQVYSPDQETSSGFHRALFVFICTNSECWKNTTNPTALSSNTNSQHTPVLVFRSQLGRENQFYPADPPREEPDWRTDIRAECHGSLCPVCGCRGDKGCAQCRAVSYCGPAHQRLDWRRGHKQECVNGAVYTGPHATDLFNEGLIEIEEEPDKQKESQSVPADLSSLMSPTMEAEDVDDQDWDEIESTQTEDKASEKFNERVKRDPHQILRYDRHGEALLCSYSRQGAMSCEPCTCGATRSFEFQIMPQLLSVLGLGLDDGIDWGSIYVYTCSRSCDITGYRAEASTILHFDNTNLPL